MSKLILAPQVRGSRGPLLTDGVGLLLALSLLSTLVACVLLSF